MLAILVMLEDFRTTETAIQVTRSLVKSLGASVMTSRDGH